MTTSSPVAPGKKRLPLPLVSRTEALPLSFMQQRLWFLAQMEGTSATYNVYFFVRLTGALDAGALERALQAVVDRHESLRTTFAAVDGQPVQRIAPTLALTLRREDLSGREQALREHAEAEARTPFDLERGPLVRATLVRLSPEEHALLFVTHHIVCDAVSLGWMANELSALYSAFTRNEPPKVPELPAQYADFAHWQRQALTGDFLEAECAWWKERLTGAPPALELPTDRPRPPRQTSRGAVYRLRMPQALATGIRELSRKAAVTPYMTLLAAFQLLLSRYSGQEDLVVGTPVAGRGRREVERLIGFFANTLALRLDTSGDPTFLALLGRVRDVCLGAYSHPDMPFEQLVDLLVPQRDPSRSPLFQAMFVHVNSPWAALKWPGLTVTELDFEPGVARFDITLFLYDDPSGMEARWEYNADLFDEATMARMAAHYARLLEGAVATPEAPVSALPLLTARERERAVVDWNDTGADVPVHPGVHALFEASVRRSPDAIAVRFGDERLTYAELDRRANRVAHALRQHGVTPDTAVGLCVDRSLELAVGVLGILKSGAAYCPLDPAYPPERLALMLETSRAKVLVTRRSLASGLPEGGAERLFLEDDLSTPDTQPAPVGGPDTLAYVIFTSGSTGVPKGVAMPHRPLFNLIQWQVRRSTAPRGRTLQFSALSFDVCFQEMLPTFAAGGELVLVSEDTRRDGRALLTLMRDQGVERIFLPFVALQHLAEVADAEGLLPTSLKEINTAGEQLRMTPALRRLLHALDGCVLDNHYGPTETHAATAHVLKGNPDAWPDLPPIGRTITNARTYLLDARWEPVPVGVAGELYIGGAGLARGYLHRPDLTAERFMPDPLSPHPGARMYRTGDFARYLPDGTMEFLGRRDAQVKIRGYRIELPEVEAAVAKLPGVKDVAVVAREDAARGKHLVAYVVTQPGADVDAGGLKATLRDRLPEYMVPAAFVLLDAFPLTPSGKLDRRALPAPDDDADTAQAFVAPRTSLETEVAEVFAALLRLPRVGALDHFFERGGHSLLATQVTARLRDRLQVELPVRALFEYPTVEELAAHLASLRTKVDVQGPTLAPRPRDEVPPLSSAQARLWFLTRMDPDGFSYNLPWFTRWSGPLDEGALERSLQVLVQRHEALRTTFVEHHGQPAQHIAPTLHVPLRREHVSSEAELSRRAEAEVRLPFDLSRGPLVRATLVRVRDAEHALLVTFHHIICDGWSLGVFERELTALYHEATGGAPAALPPLSLQPADFARWQQQTWVGTALEERIGWWKARLQDAPAFLDLPTDRPRPAVQTFEGAHLSRKASPALSRALEALAQQEGATPFMLLLAGFQALLARYSGQDDVVIGAPLAGRERQELEGLVGFFINTVPLRITAPPGTNFRELVGRVRDLTLEAFAHQDMPFEQLVRALQPERDPSRAPLFQVMFVLQNAGGPAASALPDVSVAPMDVETGMAKFDLTLFAQPSAEGLDFVWEYNTALFDEATVARMAEHYTRLLAAAAARLDEPVARLPLLTNEEQQRLLFTWNDTHGDYPREASLPALFEEQARRAPEAIALEFEGRQLTYGELDARANQLAHHLRSLGVDVGTPVGLCTHRSLEMVVATLAILKAGGAYVPLDPAYPTERLLFMARDTRLPVLLTQPGQEAKLAELETRVVSLEPSWDAFAHESTRAPRVTAPADALAYVMYTSGSTGRPKGVCIPHRGVVRLVKGTTYAHFGPEEVLLQLAPISFDASTLEIWGALLHGSKLVVLPPQPPSLEELARVLEQQGITTLFITTALFNQMAMFQPRALARVRQVMTGGEAMSLLAARQVREAGRDVINVYGPTENSTYSTAHRLEGTMDDGRPVPIGRPITNTQAYVLDALGAPVPVGVAGELYLGGDGLAWGYLHQPAQTAERFVPHPFSTTPGARLYRSGDRVRWRADGVLDFLGRSDSQVKVRGFRIEPGEIEATLKSSPGVENASVVVREDTPGDKRLVAYVVGGRVEAGGLRAWLAARLPAHMVPSAFVKLERLPLSPSGKVDRKALPAPEARTGPDSYVAPREGWEALVAEVWAPLLVVPRVGAHDHFFELGGHSLLATRVVSRLRDMLQRDVPLRLLLESPTVAGFAERLESLQKGGVGAPVPAIVATSRNKPRPLSFAQQRLWFLARLDPQGSAYNVPFYFHLDGPLDIPALEGALDALIQRHDVLRTRYSEDGGQPVQHVAEHRPFTLALESMDGEALLRARAEAEVKKPFDLEHGPLVRGTLIRAAPERHVLLLTMHHIVCDFGSINILVRELKALYTARHQDEPLELPPLPVQFPDFAGWQRQVMGGETLESQRTWWKQHLEGAPPNLELPTDRPRPPVQTYQGLQLPRPLPGSFPAAVQSLARDAGVTPFMLLLAGFHALLARHSGQDDVVIGTPIAGRGQREVENLIGFFTNTLALRVDASGAESFRALLGRVREACLGAYAHQDMPFEQLVDVLVPTRDPGRTPLFQVMFVFQSGGAPWELPGLHIRALDFDPGMAKFDLTLFVRETPEGWGTLWEYNTALFDEATVARFADHYTRLLESALAAPDAPLGTLPMLADAERRQLAAWALRPTAFPSVPNIHAFFEATATRTPDAVAVRFGDATLTYGELERRANQLAHHLRSLGVGTDVRVGIHLRRSLELPVAVLGTLKAGGAYVPLDPAYPPERLTAMLQASGAAVLLTTRELRDVLGNGASRVLELDTQADVLAREPDTRPEPRGTAQALAYVIFTSGSTGTPKGIAMHHEALVNLLHWQLGDSVAPRARTLQFSALSFDVSFQELFATWAAGGELVLLTEELRRDASQLLALMEGAGIERFFMPFVALQNLAEVAEREGRVPSRVREIMVAGEALRMTPAIRRFMKRTGAVLHNHYGPSEAHAVTSLSLKGDPDTWPALPSIGRPLINVAVHVLDANLQPVPRGVTGELYVGGVQVGRGYLDQPGLTADRFIPDPHSPTPGGRLYRSGDWARYLPDGTLEFLGRRDAQVKVRGFRIELGEIEAALAQHPSVRDCIVDARDDGSGQKRLVAWVVGASGKSPDVGTLRSFLQQRLPEYMVPARWVAMEKFPLTPSGKVNRKALPAPEGGREPTRTLVGPRTPLELQLVRIWEEVLGVHPIGVHDNFFELGGHSLLTLRVQSAIHGRLGRTLPVTALFQNATVEHLASELRDAAPWTPLVALQKGKQGVRPFFCVHAVGGSVVPYAELARALGPDQPFYGLQARGLDGESPPCESIAEMAALYVRAVREVQPHGPYLLGGWSLGGDIAWEMAHQLRREGETVSLLALLDSSASLHFGNPDDLNAKARLSANFLEDLLRASGHPLPPNEGLTSSQWKEVLEEASRPLFAAEQSLHQLRHAFEVHLNAGWVYEPPPASGPFTSFEAEGSRWDHGWAAYAPGGLDAHTVPGDHYSFLKPPHLQVLAAKLREAIAKAQSSH